MNKRYILTAKYISAEGKQKEYEHFISGTTEEKARKTARSIRGHLLYAGYKSVRVEIWEVIATSYKGTIRGERT